jgi:hypothetical protein
MSDQQAIDNAIKLLTQVPSLASPCLPGARQHGESDLPAGRGEALAAWQHVVGGRNNIFR